MVKKTGRPLKEFDKALFEDLCFIHCTNEELENIMHADRETISNWVERTYNMSFSAAYKKFSDGGKASLRRIQFNMAKKSAAMAIWLGKQYLGQRDEAKNELNPALVAPLVALFEAVKAVQLKPQAQPSEAQIPVASKEGADSQKSSAIDHTARRVAFPMSR